MSSDRITTLELRQQSANNVIGNGNFQTILQTPITIEEGDEVVITNSFLDTTTQTNTTVNIDEDINLEFEFYPWVNNIYIDGKVTDGPAPLKLDGMKHIPCTFQEHTGGKTGYSLLQFIVVTQFDDSSHYYGNYTIVFDYIDINDTPQKVSVYCPTSDVRDLNPQVNAIGILYKDGTLKLDPTMNLLVINSEPYNMRVSASPTDPNIEPFDYGTISIPITQNSSYNPVTFKKSITIPAGVYQPDLFADTITKLMTVNNQTPLNEVSGTGVQNTLLQASSDFPPNTYTFVNAEASFVTASTEKAGPGFNYTGTLDNAVWVGTNQFALEFDANTSRYVIVDMHMPIYINGNKCVVQMRADDGSVFPATAYSGISIRNIIATSASTGIEIQQFALNVLGLEIGKLNPPITYNARDVVGQIGYAPNLKFISGVNYTSAFNGIDVRVNKDLGNTGSANESTFTKVSLTSDVVNIVGDSTDSIFGDNIFSSGAYTFGYYKIEINSVFKNLLIGEETIQRNIMGIVSKYYESESYTDGTQGIPYIHKGAPVQLSQIGVRILNSNNVVPDIIGDDNTIFLQITKAQKQILPPQPAKK
jgi:hypothetical protein